MTDVTVTIGVDNKGAITGIKQVGTQAETTAKETTGHLGKIGGALADIGKIAGGIVLAKAFEAGTSAIRDAFSAAADYQKMQAATAAVIESTGGKAGITAKEVVGLANNLEKLTAVDDQVIQGAENLLLTFTNIGKDVFPEATKTVLNMSVALGQDAKSSAIQLGKALNDPINGVTALRRVGVSFTEAQLAQIKAMQESGDLMGAQKIILGELSTEFGGAAEAAGKTFGGQLSLLKDTISDTFRDIALKALPTLVTLTSLLADGLAAGIDLATVAIGNIVTAMTPFVEKGIALAGIAWDKMSGPLATVAGLTWDALKDGAAALGNLAGLAWDKIEGPLKFLADIVWTAIKDGAEALAKLPGLAWDKMEGPLRALADIGWDALKDAAKAAQDLTSKVGELTPQIKALSDANGDGKTKTDDLAAAWGALKDKLQPAFDILKPLAGQILQDLKSHADILKQGISDLGGAFADLGRALAPLSPVLEPLGKLLGLTLVAMAAALLLAIDGIVKAINLTLIVAFYALTAALEFTAGYIENFIKTFSMISDAVGPVISAMYNAGEYIVKGLWNGITAWGGWLKDNITGWAGDVISAAKSGFGIFSPSKEFAEIGKYVVQGFVMGIAADTPAAVSAVKDLARDITTTFKTDIASLYDNVPDYVKKLMDPVGKNLPGQGTQAAGTDAFTSGVLNNGATIYTPKDPKVGDWMGSGTNAQQWDGTAWIQGGIQNGRPYNPDTYSGQTGGYGPGNPAPIFINIDTVNAQTEADARTAAGTIAYSLATAGMVA